MNETNNPEFSFQEPEFPKDQGPNTPAPSNYPQYPPQNHISFNLSSQELKSLTGWATFRAIIDIIAGAFFCLGFVFILPAVYGVLRIISGVKLLNAVDSLKRYIVANDTQRVSEAFQSLRKYFKFGGIGTIVYICIGIIVFILYIALVAYFLSQGIDPQQNPNFQDFLQKFQESQSNFQ